MAYFAGRLLLSGIAISGLMKILKWGIYSHDFKNMPDQPDLKLHQPSTPEIVIISCLSADWQDDLLQSLRRGCNVDLASFFYPEHGQLCETIARELRFDFSVNHKERLAQFR